MSTFDQHRHHMLQELGIGPVWQLRHRADMPAEAPVPVVAHAPVNVVDVQAQQIAAVELNASPVAKLAEPVISEQRAHPPSQPQVDVTKPEMPSLRPQVLSQEEAMPPQVATQAEAKPVIQLKAETETNADASPISGMSWEVLQPLVENCRACGLCKGRSKSVFGTGDQRAKWLFVGEGPGYNENLQGLPFVGAAGQLLDNMLKALGLARGDQTYIANIVKCRPTDENGKDRPPTADEIATCLPYLHRQIALIQPQVIVALGKTAAVSLLGMDLETPVGQLRGRLHHFNDIPLVVTYHPAYLLRKPADKSKAWVDLCMAMQAMPVT
ncbi:uracil-DNA glycosylase family protein [Undibacterium sp. Ji49W]|uniref:uracil-DNA glycosylase n=1 Tax=Undibacterium sp. Ji49W TaxID=3413040 RepID=UPI003BF445C3